VWYRHFAASTRILAMRTFRNLATVKAGVNRFYRRQYAKVQPKRLPSAPTAFFDPAPHVNQAPAAISHNDSDKARATK